MLRGDGARRDRTRIVRNRFTRGGHVDLGRGHLVDGDPEPVGDHVHRLREERQPQAQYRRFGQEGDPVLSESHPVDVIQWCVGDHIHDFVDPDGVDSAHHPGQRER